MDPIKTGDDWDEIEVPAKIQDLIERNIRTLSNSLSSKSDVYAHDMSLDIKDLREKWLTKKEKMLENQEEQIVSSAQITLQSSRQTKFKLKKPDAQTNEGQAKNGYNLTEHSQNIRVKIDRQGSKENPAIEQMQTQQASSTDEQVAVENSSNSGANLEDAKSSSRTSSLQNMRGM